MLYRIEYYSYSYMPHVGHLFSKCGDFTHYTSVVLFLIGRDLYLPVYLGSYVTRTLYAVSPTSSACQLLTRDRGDGRPAVDRFVRRERAQDDGPRRSPRLPGWKSYRKIRPTKVVYIIRLLRENRQSTTAHATVRTPPRGSPSILIVYYIHI